MTGAVFVPLEYRAMVTWGVLGVETLGNRGKWGRGTYSTCLDQEGGSLMVMNTQLVRMVIIMNMLNSVGGRVKESEGAGGEERRTEGLLSKEERALPFSLDRGERGGEQNGLRRSHQGAHIQGLSSSETRDCTTCELRVTFYSGKMKTVAGRTAFQTALRSFSKEAEGKVRM